MSSKWVSALHDHSAGINSVPECVGLSDLHGDGDYKLIIGDMGTGRYNMRLKVFKGLTLIGESVLTDVPSAVVPFINELIQPTLPSIAISSGPSILIYKNLKPFYKFNIPAMEINDSEMEAWLHVEASQIDATQLFAVLAKLRKQLGTVGLTARSQAFLMAKEEEREQLIEHYRGKKLIRQSIITCMSTLKKSTADSCGIDCIVIGTEVGMIYCVDSQAFTVLSQCQVPAAPVFIHATGVYDVDYRIFVSTREAEVFTIKRGVESLQRATIALKSDIIGMIRVGKQLVVACEDSTISFFSAKGRRQNQLKMNTPIRCIDVFVYTPRQYTALLVALDNEIRIYQELFLMDSVKIDTPIKWIRYGPMGREEGALVIGCRNGGLIVKLFRRTAKLDQKCGEMGPPVAQTKKLNVPRRTKIFVDQTIREREQAQTMHQIFQRDLFMLRLSVTRAYAGLMQNALGTVSTKKNEAVEISVEINGFGPTFRMIVKLRVAS
ncbi:unnamed protein product [Anisakis simplex]|uniref:BBS1 domain-containing protein n=1 Tax=Anisakis simplex TaxID=6269 RepID=A0A0M3K566_ANISI|nr:unnamed protein product [Anisakis simplex]